MTFYTASHTTVAKMEFSKPKYSLAANNSLPKAKKSIVEHKYHHPHVSEKLSDSYTRLAKNISHSSVESCT